jgi:hypothetical protein
VAVLTRPALPRQRTWEPAEEEPAEDNPLTTKEGWRRFVDKQPDPPTLLTEDALAGLDEPAGRATTRPVSTTTPTCRW